MENIIEQDFKIQCLDEQDLNKKKIELRRSSYQGLFMNEDGTHNIEHSKNQIPRYGEYINTYNGIVMRIIDVVETRDHKGVFSDEKNRSCVSVVEAQKIVFSLSL